jgi:hypothetical protein
MIEGIGMKHVVKKRSSRRPRRRVTAPRTLDALVSKLKAKYPADMVDRCLKEQTDGLSISQQDLIACSEKTYKAAQPRAFKDIKRNRGKDVKR